ncbi:MAG: exo-alpha-sialidase [Lachnospiraceae bacterium]|nr:exo-alpha-sialidase [Lachnospiraceae bacterium]
MKKVGKEVLFLPTSENNLRNGEGTFIRLKNGDIMFAFTEYYGDCGEDHGTARISACISHDEGETWSDRQVLIEKDEKAQNIMTANLIRMNNGDLGIIYLRKELTEENGCLCMPVFRRSADEGKTWSDFTYCTNQMGYYVPFNGSSIKLRSGRIILPAPFVCKQYDIFNLGLDAGIPENGDQVYLFYSDDDGITWDALPHVFTNPYDVKNSFAEPAMYEHENGDLWILFRTTFGHQYQSISRDGGLTWSMVVPNFCFTSPDAPMQVEKCGKYTAAVFNPVPYYQGNLKTESWSAPKRTPLVLAISENDGREFSDNKRTTGQLLASYKKDFYFIEDDLNESYCYPSILGCDDYMLVSYYHSGGTGHCLSNAKVVKITYDELTQ